MSRITDYAFLFQKSFGTSGVNAIGSFQLSQLNSSSVQSQLKAAGINTNSKQYKAAIKKMMLCRKWCDVWQYSGNKKSDESL